MDVTERARVVSAAMQKGGVGKTTSVLNLARAGAVRHLRVLVVDFDPQGNTTATLAADPVEPDQLTIADAIVSEAALPEVIVPTVWPGVALAPAVTESLTTAEGIISAAKHGREHRLAEALAEHLGDYDLVLIDNAPTLGLLLVNALAASDQVFVVVEADQWSADGLAELRRTVNGAKRYYNPHLSWSGVLISKWRNTVDERDWLAEIVEHFPEAEVWDQDKIPLWTAVKTTLNAGKGLDESREARLRVLGDSYGRILAHWIPAAEEVTV